MAGKRVLITGAGGCIGSALADTCSQLPLESLVLLDNCERSMYELDQSIHQRSVHSPRTCIVGDICDELTVEHLFAVHSPQVVFHAAACKHVPLMEKNPFAAAKTNILGTQVLTANAKAHSAEQFILLSTDKAVNPASIMGATKRVAELIVLANCSSMQMKAVRLGNVLDSSGSVVPAFLHRIEAAQAVEVTHPDATRFFFTLEEAVLLLFSALLFHCTADILVAVPGKPHRVLDLARFLIDQSQRACSPEIPIVFTELRPGDKLHEQMISERETTTGAEKNSLRVVRNTSAPRLHLDAALKQISHSLHTRSLEDLLAAIRLVVPEYRPSRLLSPAELPVEEFR